MKKLLVFFALLYGGFANAQVDIDNFVGNWISTTQLIAQVGDIPHFTIGIEKKAGGNLCLNYCYISPDGKNEDCSSSYLCSALIDISSVKDNSFEVDFITANRQQGRVLITQQRQYLYWKLIIRPPQADFLPQEEVFAKDL